MQHTVGITTAVEEEVILMTGEVETQEAIMMTGEGGPQGATMMTGVVEARDGCQSIHQGIPLIGDAQNLLIVEVAESALTQILALPIALLTKCHSATASGAGRIHALSHPITTEIAINDEELELGLIKYMPLPLLRSKASSILLTRTSTGAQLSSGLILDLIASLFTNLCRTYLPLPQVSLCDWLLFVFIEDLSSPMGRALLFSSMCACSGVTIRVIVTIWRPTSKLHGSYWILYSFGCTREKIEGAWCLFELKLKPQPCWSPK